MNERKVIVYIAMSMDGYIAKPDDNLDFLNKVEKEGEDYGYHDFINTIDTVIIGRKTYEKVLSFGIGNPHAERVTYVITSSVKTPEENIIFYNDDIELLVKQLKFKKGKNIFVDGGAQLVNFMLSKNLIDEMVISTIPVILGEGISLFQHQKNEISLQLLSCKSFEKGLVQMHYKVLQTMD